MTSDESSRFAPRLPKRLTERFGRGKRPPAWVLLGAVLLVSGGAIAYLNFRQRAPRSLVPVGMQVVPKTALATVTLTTDELTWTKLRQFGTADTQQQLDAFLTGWKERLFATNGYSFKRDVKPWIGDRVTLAVLPAEAAGNASGGGLGAQDFVLVVPIEDALKAKATLGAALEQSEAVKAVRTYKGIEVQTVASPEGDTVETAAIGTNWILLGSTAAAIDTAIDTYKGGRSLLDVTGYRKAATQMEVPLPQGKNFAQLYVNIPAVTKAINTTGEPPGNTSRASVLPLQGSEGLVSRVLVEPEGLRFEGTSWLLPKQDLVYGDMSNEAGEMPRRLPGDTLVMMSGSNLQQFWRGFSEGNTSPPFFPNPQNLKAGLLTQTGLDIDEDIMPWAAGEFALGVLPPKTDADSQVMMKDGEPAEQPIEQPEDTVESAPLLIMVQTNDRAKAESVWSQLDDVIASRYRFAVEESKFEGGSVTRWVSPFQGVQFSHGWLPGNVTFFSVGSGVGEAIAPKPNESLAQTRLFQTLTSKAPKPNNGNFYIDLARINQLDNVFPLPQIGEEGPTAAIRAVGLTSEVGDRTMDYELYVKLAKAAKPGPL